MSARLGRSTQGLLANFIQETDTVVLPFTQAHYSAAHQAWLNYGKCRHTAALSFGDCAACAAALLAGKPLLCTGDDFAQTALQVA